MEIRKAVITAAGREQRSLPLQTLVGRDGVPKPALRILLEESTDDTLIPRQTVFRPELVVRASTGG